MNEMPRNKWRTKAEIEAGIRDLPVLPRVVVELTTLDPSSDGYADGVRAVAEADPPFAIRIVAAANSANSAPIQDIMTVSDAVNRLGAVRVANLITSLAALRVFVPSSHARKNLWRHALQVAIAGREIAAAGTSKVSPSKAYLVGLLHDIGRFVMFDLDPIDLEAIDARAWKTPSELLEIEFALCGFNHAEIGALACRTWGIPEEIELAIQMHHRSERVTPPELDALVRVIQLADRTSCEMLQNRAFAGLEAEEQKAILASFCEAHDDKAVPIDAATLLQIMPKIEQGAATQIAALGL